MRSRGQVLENPEVSKAYEAVASGLSTRSLVLVVGSCTVEYVGRASSKLSLGERLLIVKGDGSLLLHRPRGVEPVNWQPPGCRFNVGVSPEGWLRVEAVRPKPTERVTVGFKAVELVSVFRLEDRGAFAVYASEEDMKAAILSEPSLLEEGFRPVAAERQAPVGFIDCLGRDRDGRLTVVEIKRRRGDRTAVRQLAQYMKSLGVASPEARGILAAPSISREAEALLRDLHLEFRRLSPKRCAEVLQRRRHTPAKRLSDYLDRHNHPNASQTTAQR
ncbi:MAG: endonuclease NucS [Candidatus Bathyarchaeia archaeon]